MGLLLLAAFIVVPIIEIALFIEVGGRIGLWSTLGLVVLTAIVGTWLLRAQGLAVLMRARTELDGGRLPARELFDGACLLVAGAFLLTPGFFTDGLGFLLLFPPVRLILRQYFAKRMTLHMETYGPQGRRAPGSQRRPGGPTPEGDGVTIDGSYQDVTESAESDKRDDAKEKPGEPPKIGREGPPNSQRD
jgi:UPF0716 protein FxsA